MVWQKAGTVNTERKATRPIVRGCTTKSSKDAVLALWLLYFTHPALRAPLSRGDFGEYGFINKTLTLKVRMLIIVMCINMHAE